MWSLGCLYEGVHPDRDFGGRPWQTGSFGHERRGRPLTTAGWFGVTFRIQGDLEWFSNSLGLNLHPAATNPCCFDASNRTTRPFLDLSRNAAWLETVYAPPQPAPNEHPIWRAPGASLFAVTIDEMHTEDVGVILEYIGSVLWTFVYDSELEGNPDARMRTIWGRIRDLYAEKAVRTRLVNLTLSMFTEQRAPRRAYPTLSAHAAEARALLPLIVQMCSDLNTGSARDALRLHCGLCLVRFNATLHAAGRFLTTEEHTRATEYLWGFLGDYAQLAEMHASRGLLLFKVINKHHHMVHLCQQSLFCKPPLFPRAIPTKTLWGVCSALP